jgi:hypothetical protein
VSTVPPQPRERKRSACSGLQSDVLPHEGHTCATIDSNVPRIRPVLDVDAFTGVHEQRADLRGSVAELVGQIGIPPRSVDEGTAIGAEEPSDELPGLSAHDVLLPVLERDVSIVLPAGAVLREKTRQMCAVQAENRRRALRARQPADAVCGEAAAEKRLRLGDDLPVPRVEIDSQPVAAPSA